MPCCQSVFPLVQSRSRKTTSFPIPLFTVGIRPSLSLGLISVLNISLRNFQGRCLLFSYQGSLLCCLSHLSDNFCIISCRLAICQQLFSAFFFFLVRRVLLPTPADLRSRARYRAAPHPAKNPPSCVVDFYNIIITPVVSMLFFIFLLFI